MYYNDLVIFVNYLHSPTLHHDVTTRMYVMTKYPKNHVGRDSRSRASKKLVVGRNNVFCDHQKCDVCKALAGKACLYVSSRVCIMYGVV